MERFAMRRWVYVFFMAIFFACTSKDTKTQFEISGVVTNNSVQKIYLEEAQAGGSGRTVVDSFVIGEDGQYRLKTKPREAMLYGIRLANHEVPSLFVINDAPKISVDIELNKQNAQLIDKYEVKQSPASTAMKNFISAFDNDLQKLYSIIRRANSLKSQNAPDSSILPLQKEWTIVAENIKDHGLTAINEADNPALIVFELGYFQGLNNDYGLEPLTLKQEFDILSKASNKFPDH
ncbi:MAG TPA: DUF4369 domain-containing protein, partial [Chitinophagaceae bacterium]|nr:DUF4369 domain-containing protein [Chitinophagaceae bacterium]